MTAEILAGALIELADRCGGLLILPGGRRGAEVASATVHLGDEITDDSLLELANRDPAQGHGPVRGLWIAHGSGSAWIS